jgi:pyridoxine 4-dehydrogenase
MRAVVVREYGGPDVLELTEVPDPRHPGEVIVDIAASGINFIDVYHRTVVYRRPLPFVPGVEAAGTVSELGRDVRCVRVGDRVAWVDVPDGYAERAAVPDNRLILLPGELTEPPAEAVLLQGMTAHYLVHDVDPVVCGDTVLVHAAAGGVGLLLTRFAKLRGGRVIAAVSAPEKVGYARAAGADEVIQYGGADIAATVRELTGGGGVAAVYDGVGAPTFEASLASLRSRGVLALFGQAGGTVPPVDLQGLNSAGSMFVTQPNLSHCSATREDLLARADNVLELTAAGKLAVDVHRIHALEHAAAAHWDLQQCGTARKLLLRGPGPPSPPRCINGPPRYLKRRTAVMSNSPSTYAIGADMPVNRLGFGAMHLTGDGVWGEPHDWQAALAVARRAVELGLNFIDTADSYGLGVSERVLADALHPYPDGMVIATKAGQSRPSKSEWRPLGRPEYLRQQAELSLQRLRVERLDLFYLHRIDPQVPRADQFGALLQLQQEGKVRHIGLSEVTVDDIQEARSVIEVVSVQNLYNLAQRHYDDVIDYCEREGIAFMAWLPIGSGAHARPDGALATVAKELGATPAQTALAWLLHRSPAVIAIPGTSSITHLEEDAQAAAIELNPAQFELVSQAV